MCSTNITYSTKILLYITFSLKYLQKYELGLFSILKELLVLTNIFFLNSMHFSEINKTNVAHSSAYILVWLIVITVIIKIIDILDFTRIPASRTNEHLVDCLPDFYLCLALSKINNTNLSLSNRIQIKDLFTYQKNSLPFSYNNFLIYKLLVRYLNYIYNLYI